MKWTRPYRMMQDNCPHASPWWRRQSNGNAVHECADCKFSFGIHGPGDVPPEAVFAPKCPRCGTIAHPRDSQEQCAAAGCGAAFPVPEEAPPTAEPEAAG